MICNKNSGPALLLVIGACVACQAPLQAIDPASARDVAGAPQAVRADPEPPDSPAGSSEVTASDVTNPDTANAYLDETLRYTVAQEKKWRVDVHASQYWRYDSNFLLRNGNPQSDSMWILRPDVRVAFGDDKSTLKLSADYAAELTWLAKNSSQDAANHFLRTELKYLANKTTFTFQGNYALITGGDVDVGGQAQRVQLQSVLEVRHELTEKVGIGTVISSSISDYKSYNNVSVTRFGVYGDYTFSPSLRLGLQFDENLEDVQGTGSQTVQDALLRVNWNPLPKLTVAGGVGAEFRHPKDNSEVTSPTGTLTFGYDLGPKTKLRLDLYDRTQNSAALTGEYFQSTGTVLGVSQKIGEKLYLGLDLGADNSVYRSSFRTVAASRHDQVYFYRPSIRYALFTHLSADISYQGTFNNSTGYGSESFNRDIVGIGVTATW